MRRTDAQNARRRAARAVPKATMVVTTFMVPATMILLVAGILPRLGHRLRLADGEVTVVGAPGPAPRPDP